MLGGEVEEGEQSFLILRQASDRLVVLGTVFVGEHIDRHLGCRTGRRAVNLTKVGLHVDLDRACDLVQDIGSLVDPTPLVPGARKDFLDRLPEAERTIADGKVRRDLEPTLLDVDEEFTPALCAFADSDLEADEFLLAFGCCTGLFNSLYLKCKRTGESKTLHPGEKWRCQRDVGFQRRKISDSLTGNPNQKNRGPWNSLRF